MSAGARVAAAAEWFARAMMEVCTGKAYELRRARMAVLETGEWVGLHPDEFASPFPSWWWHLNTPTPATSLAAWGCLDRFVARRPV